MPLLFDLWSMWWGEGRQSGLGAPLSTCNQSTEQLCLPWWKPGWQLESRCADTWPAGKPKHAKIDQSKLSALLASLVHACHLIPVVWKNCVVSSPLALPAHSDSSACRFKQTPILRRRLWTEESQAESPMCARTKFQRRVIERFTQRKLRAQEFLLYTTDQDTGMDQACEQSH